VSASPPRIPYVDLVRQHGPILPELLAAAERVLKSGRFILGEEVEHFEARMADYCGTRHAVSVGTGTDALILSMRALDIGPGDEVILPPNTFYSVVGAILEAGGRPVFADVAEDANIDPDHIEPMLTPKTRALIPTHFAGRPARMDRILEIARKHHLAVIEDAAQAIGARFQGRPVGSLGDAGCFSLHPLKTLGACGDGGVIVTDREDLREKIRLSRNNGLRDRNTCLAWSRNSRLDELQAAILNVKFKHLDHWIEQRRAHAVRYRQRLARFVGVPEESPQERHAYHYFMIRSKQRDALREHLADCGIQSEIHYPVPLHAQPAGAGWGYRPEDFPRALLLSRETLSLPVFHGLREEEHEAVCHGIQDFFG
jgi:dTDP-4-amino-4,6-dideoxygalactose transaminase